MPLSATIAKAELMRWTPGAHASTFGGNPVCIAAALATIGLLEGGMIANAARMGRHLMARFKSWPERYANVGDVRGIGLMIGIEIVKDQKSRERATELRDRICDLAFERGLVLLGAGPSSIRLSPPLCITEEQADFAADTLEECLRITGRT
jgi:4-aminobutyrate aminotransferase